MIETLKSTEILTKEGFKVMVYCNDDPLMAKTIGECWCLCNNAFSSSNWIWILVSKIKLNIQDYKKSD